MTQNITQSQTWQDLTKAAAQMRAQRLDALFASDGARVDRYRVKADNITTDFSRNHIDDHVLSLFESLAQTQDLAGWREKMFSGDKINVTEGRAVLHTALRAADDAAPIMVDGENVLDAVRGTKKRLRQFVQDVRSGAWRGATGKQIRTVVNIGIGGSDLGPRLAVMALRDFNDPIDVRFAANVDDTDLRRALIGVRLDETLFVIVSKTFTTQETLMNAQTARSLLIAELGEDAVAKHFVAVSTNAAAVSGFGIGLDNMFPMWDWVGGRYSVWSAVGISVALALGFDAFEAFLAGGRAMDTHFRTAPWRQNMPFMLGVVGLWYRSFWGSGAHAILPYCERLREMPRFLQQLEMESNGKCVTREGAPVGTSTSPVIFGECGTVGQHSFHQWLHQGTDIIPADFIGVQHDPQARADHHRALMANLIAQSDALLYGRAVDAPGRTNPGNKPSTLIWMDQLTPHSFGQLCALYEHKVFVQGILWGINSFDQFGVELGKVLAKEALQKMDAAA